MSTPEEAVSKDWQEVTVTIDRMGRKVFALDGMLTQWVRKMRGMLNLRGPDDFEHEDEDIADRVAGIIARKYQARHVNYNNGDTGNGEKRLLRWILGVLSALAVLTIAGGVTLYGEFTALRATVTTGMNAHEQRIDRVEQRLDRASPNAP